MTSKRFAVFIGLLLASTGVLGQVSTTYPEKKGIVNDYAGKLTGAQTHELANLTSNMSARLRLSLLSSLLTISKAGLRESMQSVSETHGE